MRPSLRSSPTSTFFSSLRKVEKRLKLDNSPQPSNPSPPPLESSKAALTESLCSPIYLNSDQFHQSNNTNNVSSSTFQETEPPPPDFLSDSPDFPPTNQPQPYNNNDSLNQFGKGTAFDDIELLVQLLGLSGGIEEEEEDDEQGGFGLGVGDDDFLSKVVGVKGPPKSGKEVERLGGWIKHYWNTNGGGEGNRNRKREPLRLAHLLLGKAALLSSHNNNNNNNIDDDGFQFPSTIQEFLQTDPPM